MAIELPFSAACERNKDPILSVISPYLLQAQSVLEIGSGTAQHAIHFASHHAHLEWQTSDQLSYLQGIQAQLDVAKIDNVKSPVILDVNQSPWLSTPRQYDVVYTANTFHIMNEADVKAFFAGLIDILKPASGTLIVYGPFNYQGKFTSQSNAEFDQRLRDRGVGSAIRDIEWLQELATVQGLELREDYKMPANNQCLIWQFNV